MLILFKSFLLLDPNFLPSYCFTSVWHFENSSALLWNPRYFEKGALPEHFTSNFKLQVVMPFLHESKHTKLMTSLIINLWLAVFYLQLLSWGGHWGQRWPNSSSSSHFTLYPPLPVSSNRPFCKAFTSIFCVLLWQCQMLLKVFFKCSLHLPYGPPSMLPSCVLPSVPCLLHQGSCLQH